jgi:HSP20 family protein
MKLIRTNGPMSPVVVSLLNDFFADQWTQFHRAGATPPAPEIPPANIVETGEDFHIEIAAPGLQRDLFKAEFVDDILSVSYVPGVKETSNKYTTVVLREFGYGGFERSFMLPKQKVNGEKIEARYADGILMIKVPKREEMKKNHVRQISIS